MTEPYVLASSDAIIVLARDVGEGTFRVTAWTRGKEEKVDRAGARVCAQHAAGQWSRMDRRPSTFVGIPPPWTQAWKLCAAVVPELNEVGLRAQGGFLVIGEPKQRVESERARAKRVKERKRAGQKVENVEETKTDQGPTGLGGMRWS